MSIKYSVIVPLYNKEECVEKTIRSVLAQSYDDFEIIVIDDGSTDRGLAIVKGIKDKRVRVISQKNQGVSAARNTGIRNAKGEYICFLDADDLWKSNFLETVNELLIEFPNAEVFCPSYEVSYGKRVVIPEWRSVDLHKNSLVNDFFEMATGAFWVTHSSCAVVKKETLEGMEVLFPVGEKVYEDFDFWIRLGSKVDVAHSNKICATYMRIAPNNSRNAHAKRVVYSKTFMNTLSSMIEDINISDQQRKWIKEIKDRRIVPFVFSLLCVKKYAEARKTLNEWNPVSKYRKYRLLLKVMCFFPHPLISLIQTFRYYIF